MIERCDLLSLQTGRLALMREAVVAGKKPSDVGLPGTENDTNILVCTAKLLDAQKRVLRNASASMALVEDVDFRALETAANQRLLAALGFFGETVEASVLLSDDVAYRKYAARLPTFLKVYSPKEGYCVEVSWTDLLSLQTGRLSLLREAVAMGRKPSDVGLPGIASDVNTLVCTARLLDPQEQVVRSGSATMQVLEHKDFEKLETAANQRLLAALGFGGEVFDGDEDADLAAQSLDVPRQPALGMEQEGDSPELPSVPLTMQPLPATQSPVSEPTDEDEPVTVAEQQLIANLAKRVGATSVPTLKTRGDVKRARRELNAKRREQGTERTSQSAVSA